jgi:hypothetical protein
MMKNLIFKILVWTLTCLNTYQIFGQGCPTYTNSLPIRTGYNYQNGSIYSKNVGITDPNWIIVKDYLNYTSEPRQAFVSDFNNNTNCFNNLNNPYNSESISPLTNFCQLGSIANKPFTYEFRFCLSAINNLNLNINICVDDSAKVFLNGAYIGGLISASWNNSNNNISVNNQNLFLIGNNVITVEVVDIGISCTGMQVEGQLTSGSNSIFYPTCNGSNTNLLFNDNSYAISSIPVFNVCTNQKVNLGVSNNTYSWAWDFGDATADNGVSVNHVYTTPGNYKVTVYPQTTACFLLNPITFNINVADCPLPQCDKCISSFAPTPGDYIVSCWVKEDRTSPVTTYSNTGIKLTFNGDPIVYGPYFPNVTKNKIIEGWQRIEEKFTVPPGATDLKIALVNNSSSTSSPVDSYFDDIRIFPLDGSMKSYVYDPINLRLVAELDENNYATIYEYDEEGKLIRVKKETEKGIMTIKETRSAKRKQ